MGLTLFIYFSLTTYVLNRREQDSLLSSYTSKEMSQNTWRMKVWTRKLSLWKKKKSFLFHIRFFQLVVFSSNRKWCNTTCSLKTMDSYDYRPIYLRNWWACKWLESATINIAQQFGRCMPSGWINSTTGLSTVWGSVYLRFLLSRARVADQLMEGSQHCSAPQPWPLPVAPPLLRDLNPSQIQNIALLSSGAGNSW